nr:reverse transcriptase domain-containing protein [Tanacetum cinerariifolium]
MNNPLLANPRLPCETRLEEEKSQLRKTEAGPRLTQSSGNIATKITTNCYQSWQEKFNREKLKSEKLKELKARLNFDGCSGTSRYSESKTVTPRNTKKDTDLGAPVAQELVYSHESDVSGQGHQDRCMKQRDGESTEDFVKRYKLESRDVKGVPDCMRISGFVHGITNPELIKRLYDKISKTVDEIMRVTTSFLRGEVAASNHERKKTFPQQKQHESIGKR